MKRARNQNRGFTIIEMTMAMAISTIVITGMAIVMVLLIQGTEDSKDFARATGRIDLIRQLTFDGRTGSQIVFPTADSPAVGSAGTYSAAGQEGHRVDFVAKEYDSGTGTTNDVLITWLSRRPAGSPSGTPYVVERWHDTTPYDGNANGSLSFGESNIADFTVTRRSIDEFEVYLKAEEGDESAEILLTIALRNVVN